MLKIYNIPNTRDNFAGNFDKCASIFGRLTLCPVLDTGSCIRISDNFQQCNTAVKKISILICHHQDANCMPDSGLDSPFRQYFRCMFNVYQISLQQPFFTKKRLIFFCISNVRPTFQRTPNAHHLSY